VVPARLWVGDRVIDDDNIDIDALAERGLLAGYLKDP
jgi:hypothetical protein